jgi:hypothetical protein
VRFLVDESLPRAVTRMRSVPFLDKEHGLTDDLAAPAAYK